MLHVKYGDTRGLVGASDEPAPPEPGVLPFRVYTDTRRRST